MMKKNKKMLIYDFAIMDSTWGQEATVGARRAPPSPKLNTAIVQSRGPFDYKTRKDPEI